MALSAAAAICRIKSQLSQVRGLSPSRAPLVRKVLEESPGSSARIYQACATCALLLVGFSAAPPEFELAALKTKSLLV